MSQSNAHHDKGRMFASKQYVVSCCACEGGYKIYYNTKRFLNSLRSVVYINCNYNIYKYRFLRN